MNLSRLEETREADSLKITPMGERPAKACSSVIWDPMLYNTAGLERGMILGLCVRIKNFTSVLNDMRVGRER